MPVGVYCDIHTKRALLIFIVSSFTAPCELIIVGRSVRFANIGARLLDVGIAKAIMVVVKKIAVGKLADQLVIVTIQADTGASTDRNMEEIIADMSTVFAYQAISFDRAVTLAASCGQLALNSFLLVIVFDLRTSLSLFVNDA